MSLQNLLWVFWYPTKRREARLLTWKGWIIIEICAFFSCIICLANWTNLYRCFMLKDKSIFRCWKIMQHVLCHMEKINEQTLQQKMKQEEISQLNHRKNEVLIHRRLTFDDLWLEVLPHTAPTHVLIIFGDSKLLGLPSFVSIQEPENQSGFSLFFVSSILCISNQVLKIFPFFPVVFVNFKPPKLFFISNLTLESKMICLRAVTG